MLWGECEKVFEVGKLKSNSVSQCSKTSLMLRDFHVDKWDNVNFKIYEIWFFTSQANFG